jgi:hypothetical protein
VASEDSEPGAVLRWLSAEDLSILELENATVAGHTCKVIVLGDQIDPEQLRTSIASRRYQVPLLSARLGECDGKACWMIDPEFDLESHVVIGEPKRSLNRADLGAAVACVFERRLDRSRPLWKIEVIPQLADGGSALIWCVHHALADGATAMALAQAVLWDERAVRASPTDANPRPRSAQTAARARHRFGALGTAAREAPRPWLRSPFAGHIDRRREVAFASAPLAAVRRAAHASGGATVNDAVLTLVAGGLRRWLESDHGHLGTIRVKVPVSLHTMGASDHEQAPLGNRDSFFCLDLPLTPADPHKRLLEVRRATRIRKEHHDAEQLDSMMIALGRVPQLRRFAERVLTHSRSFALNVSNVPGPHGPVQVLGAPVRGLYSLAEIRQHHALRIAVLSCADMLNFGLTADPTLLPRVDQLAEHLEAEADLMIAQLETLETAGAS